MFRIAYMTDFISSMPGATKVSEDMYIEMKDRG